MSQLLEYVKQKKAQAKALALASVVAIGAGAGGYTLWGGPKQVSTAEASSHMGKTVRQEFVIGSSLKSKNHALLNEGQFPNHSMTVRVTPEHPAFGSIPKGRDSLKGRRIVASGTMSAYNGKPQLVVGKDDTFEIK